MTKEADLIPVPLYHGTSTLFIEGILQHGLGGMNPIQEWKVLEFARAIAPLVKQHYEVRGHRLLVQANTFVQYMVAQTCSPGGFNYQHGQAYVSPLEKTAVRYVSHNRYGSELLSRTLFFLQHLCMDVPDALTSLEQEYPDMFEKLDINPAPLLLRIDNVPVDSVLTEYGEHPGSYLEFVRECMHDLDMLQQHNFRLVVPHRASAIATINVKGGRRYVFPQYSLYPLQFAG
jgi:hypothetical protein